MNIISFWFLKFMFFAILGYIMEVIFALCKDHKLINRGFLYGPYCSIYGCAGILMALINPRLNIIVIFLLSAILCGILEGIAGFLLDYFFHMRWWNYQNQFLNINGYTCPKYMIIFGLFSIIGVFLINPFYDYLYSLMNMKILNTMTIILIIIYIVDTIISVILVMKLKNKLNKEERINTTLIIENKKNSLLSLLGIGN
ncbi:MAG: putative ABC transporter permease [Bacilli bacterium]|nr:putative ABC transporter permease [Bacilli bacterium]